MNLKSFEENKNKLDDLYKSLYKSRNKVFLLEEKLNIINYCLKLSTEDYYKFLFCFHHYFYEIHTGNYEKLSESQKLDLDRFIQETHCFYFRNHSLYSVDEKDTDFELFEEEPFYINFSTELQKIKDSEIYEKLQDLKTETNSEIEKEKQNIQTTLDKLETTVNELIELINAEKSEIEKIFPKDESEKYKTSLNELVKKQSKDLSEITNYLVYEGLAL